MAAPGPAGEVQPEMETFPILSPELIPQLSKEWLQKSQAALVPFIASLREEVTHPAAYIGF